MWTHCQLIRESLDLIKQSLIFEMQPKTPNASIIAVELINDLPTLIKIMEVTHSKREIYIAPHIKAKEIPTRILKKDIRLYSQWQSQFMTFEKVENEEDTSQSISFYKKAISKEKTIKSKQLQVFSLKKIKRQLEENVKALLRQVKENANKLDLDRKEFERSLIEHQKIYKDLQSKHLNAVSQIKKKDKALEQLRNRSSFFNLNRQIRQVQQENVAYEIETFKLRQKINQLIRLLRIQQVGGANRSFNIIQ